MRVQDYQTVNPAAGDKLFGSNAAGEQKQFAIEDFAAPTYKKYVALLTQSGTAAPSAIELENTIGNIVWSRESAGEYFATLSNAFTSNKTWLTICPILKSTGSLKIIKENANSINIGSCNSGDTKTDGILNETSIEIRVYN